MESEYIFKSNVDGEEIVIELDEKEINDDMRDELAYDRLCEKLTENIKDNWYIDEVYEGGTE